LTNLAPWATFGPILSYASVAFSLTYSAPPTTVSLTNSAPSTVFSLINSALSVTLGAAASYASFTYLKIWKYSMKCKKKKSKTTDRFNNFIF
jgi:hypothetical protein